MSLDIYVTAVIETTVIDKNITHNLSGMWTEAGIYDALYNSEGKKVSEVLPILQEGLKLIAEDPKRFKKFSAPNGWGTYNQALPWLSELIQEMQEYPNGVIGISK